MQSVLAVQIWCPCACTGMCSISLIGLKAIKTEVIGIGAEVLWSSGRKEQAGCKN